MVAEGTREDLTTPQCRQPTLLPLRERPDIPPLLNHFLQHTAAENNKQIDGITGDAVKVLMAHTWPGNVRELRNCVERMVVFARGATLTLNDVPANIRQAVSDQFQAPAEEAAAELAASENHLDIKANERALILQALAECKGNRSQAAKKLNISRRTLHRKLNQYGITGNN